MKKLVAYSSVAHMGFVTLGFFIFNDLGVSGGLVQMIAHGFVSGAMFLSIGVLYDRVNSREIASYGGVINTMPKFGAFMVLFSMANAGLPATSGFVGEFMVILASFKANFWYAFAAGTTLILGAAYTLWLVKRVIFGPVGNDHVAALTDLNRREFAILAILAVAVLLLGLWPAPLLDVLFSGRGAWIRHAPGHRTHLHVRFKATASAEAALLADALRGVERVRHRVARGETLEALGRRYGVTPAEISAENRLPPNARLRRGQRLFVLVPRAPALGREPSSRRLNSGSGRPAGPG
jgi:formate hydrogenlyase subunit 3/multisubunit Na+/H+ antiporter MnhD subunit